MRITGRTRVFALLGDPVGHSLSPAIHNAAFRALGLDAVYVAIRCAETEVAGLMTAMAGAGGGGNLTIPHKRTGAAVAEPSEPGPWSVCNTFWGDGGRVVGAETDSAGVMRAWERLGRPVGDWLVIGTGGSAWAVAAAAARVGAGVVVRSRSEGRAAEFRAECASLGIRGGEAGAVGLAVNCTPLGLSDGDPPPYQLERLPPTAAVLDLVYRPGATEWVRAARRAGRRSDDGREVLLGQGAAAFRRWFPEVPVPTEVMDAALRRTLA